MYIKEKDKVVPVLKHYTMKTCQEVEIKLLMFFTLATDESEWSACHSSNHWTGVWVSSRVSVDVMVTRKIPPLPGINPQSFSQ
jgi:hypothetical protein